LEYEDYYFSLLDRLAKANNKDPFVLSAIAQKASSDGDMKHAIAYATEVIDQGSTLTYDYLLLDGLLARSGNLPASIAILKKGIHVAPYDGLLYESLAIRQLSNGDIADGLATLQHGLDLFPENQVLRDLKDQARARGLMK
jgi:tetratricopeptide (TPR) repeat protein